VIRFGLRLTLGGGKEAAVRLAITMMAVAIGVGLLLVTLAGMNAINVQNSRTAWLDTGFSNGPGPPGTQSATPPTSTDPLWWQYSSDHFNHQPIYRVDLAAMGPTSPVPPGIPRLPGPGQYYASPALVELVRRTPASELGDRFPGTLIGTIGPSALPSPHSLIVVIGHTPAQLNAAGPTEQVTSINTDAGAGGPTGFHNSRLQVILAVGALALLFPVLIFIGTATRLAAARREQRFAAMRLVGATPRQVSAIAAVEAGVAAIAGVAVGFALFVLVGPLVTRIDFTGLPFAPGDLSLNSTDALAVAVGVPVAAAIAARMALRRVLVSPLGVTRRVRRSAPSVYRLTPLLVGIGELVYFVAIGQPKGTSAQTEAYFSGCFLMLAGLVLAGPWLTMVSSRIMAGRAQRPAVLLAGRRLADNPRAAFRAISGLIIALFATSVSVGVITTILYNNSPSLGTAADNTLIEQLGSYGGPPNSVGGPTPAQAPTVPASLLDRLSATAGVQGVTLGHSAPGANTALLTACDELARTPAIGRCAPGASVVAIDTNQVDVVSQFGKKLPSLSTKVWPPASLSTAELSRLPVGALIVETDGSTSALESARTAIQVALPYQGPPATLREINDNSRRVIVELQQMTNLVIVVSLIIAGCSLAVSVTGGINDRKRPFSLLRLTGVSLSTIRRVVGLEAALPLLVVSVLAVGMGFLAAGLFLTSQLNQSLHPPSLQFYGLVLAGLAASFAVIAATLPIVDRITGPETARNE
jgi:hypothetical protein